MGRILSLEESDARVIDTVGRLADIVRKLVPLVDLGQKSGDQDIVLVCTPSSVVVYPRRDSTEPVAGSGLEIDTPPIDLFHLLRAAQSLEGKLDDGGDSICVDPIEGIGIEITGDDSDWRAELWCTVEHERRTRPTNYDWRHLLVLPVPFGLTVLVPALWGFQEKAYWAAATVVLAVQMFGLGYPLWKGNGVASLRQARRAIKPLTLFGAACLVTCIALPFVFSVDLFEDAGAGRQTWEALFFAALLLLGAPWASWIDLILITRLLFRK